MPFLRLVKAAQEQGCVFGLDEIAAAMAAFDQIVHILQLTDGDDPVVTMIAKFIVEHVRNGEHDPNVLRRQALELFLEQFQK